MKHDELREKSAVSQEIVLHPELETYKHTNVPKICSRHCFTSAKQNTLVKCL